MRVLPDVLVVPIVVVVGAGIVICHVLFLRLLARSLPHSLPHSFPSSLVSNTTTTTTTTTTNTNSLLSGAASRGRPDPSRLHSVVAAARCLGAVSARLGRRLASYQEESVAALAKAVSFASSLATGAVPSSFSLGSSLPPYATREQAAAAMPSRGSPLEAADKVKVLLLRSLSAVIRGASCGGRRDPG